MVTWSPVVNISNGTIFKYEKENVKIDADLRQKIMPLFCSGVVNRLFQLAYTSVCRVTATFASVTLACVSHATVPATWRASVHVSSPAHPLTRHTPYGTSHLIRNRIAQAFQSSSSSSLSHFYVGSIRDDSLLHAARSYTSPDSPFSLTSSFTHSAHLFFGLPLLLLPCTSIPITLFPTYSSSLLITCPYHRILRSWTFFEICHFRGSSDLLVSDLVQPSHTAHPS